MTPTPNCCICGRFVKWDDCDSSTPFGGAADLEPPEEDYFCRACAVAQEEHHVAQSYVPLSWIKAKWERRVAARLGWVEAGPEGAAWTHWFPDKNGIPDGWAATKKEQP